MFLFLYSIKGNLYFSDFKNAEYFQEWAEFSHRRRGINESAEKETPTQQKHRFRNALARANGIVYHKEMGWEGVRVYELVGKLFILLHSLYWN